MAGELIVYKHRTNIVTINLGYDVSADTITSEIREGRASTTTLIATWDVSFLTDGTDGTLLISLDDSITSTITQKSGYMDLKRVSGGEPFHVFDAPVKVLFQETVTA